MTYPRYTDLAQGLPSTVPFVGPETQERSRGRTFDARLGANESGFGPSPSAIRAIGEAARGAWMYGDPEVHDLRRALGSHLGVAPEAVIAGEGIDALLGYIARLLVGPGDAVVTSDGAYPTFNYHVAGFGGVLHKVPYRDDTEDPEALVAKAAEVDAKIIYLANPDNPMGSFHGAERLAAMREALPEGCLLVLDEAYVEFAPEDDLLELDPSDEGIIRLRTFSKAYGLAGLRVGYGVGHPELIRAFDKIRNHFGLGRVAQAGALAALADTAHLARVQGEVEAARRRIGRIAAANGLTPLPSCTNFVTLDCGGGAARAKALVAELGRRGVFIRMPFAAPQDRCIRISAAPEAELSRLEKVLPEALAALSTPVHEK
ncbi:pyridoxal phosphate-dependent aminotransferase [Oceanicola sp. 502str15]|uniref:pyridoxal phosphate-dependent aminotransferase n=1 Tax=Oceanicola sp. 502str15 TaxID=2696061 RepID=UPI00209570DE|nr:pyridoxal phosphate-dependent aminotransferase [Oceanicola sp. 502str15]MCO6382992.1 pyridoxal phosphate-dependent aminotransferase [Oceanicola sp. 502str15]